MKWPFGKDSFHRNWEKIWDLPLFHPRLSKGWFGWEVYTPAKWTAGWNLTITLFLQENRVPTKPFHDFGFKMTHLTVPLPRVPRVSIKQIKGFTLWWWWWKDRDFTRFQCIYSDIILDCMVCIIKQLITCYIILFSLHLVRVYNIYVIYYKSYPMCLNTFVHVFSYVMSYTYIYIYIHLSIYIHHLKSEPLSKMVL